MAGQQGPAGLAAPAPILSLKTKIVTDRLDETVRFYEQVLGLASVELWDEPADRGCILPLPGGREEAFLEVYEGLPAAGWDALSLQSRTPDVDAFAASLPGEVEREGPVDRPWGSRYLYLRDPNGIPIIVFSGGL